MPTTKPVTKKAKIAEILGTVSTTTVRDAYSQVAHLDYMTLLVLGETIRKIAVALDPMTTPLIREVYRAVDDLAADIADEILDTRNDEQFAAMPISEPIWGHQVSVGRVLGFPINHGTRMISTDLIMSPHYRSNGLFEYPEPLPLVEIGTRVALSIAVEGNSRVFAVDMAVIDESMPEAVVELS